MLGWKHLAGNTNRSYGIPVLQMRLLEELLLVQLVQPLGNTHS